MELGRLIPEDLVEHDVQIRYHLSQCHAPDTGHVYRERWRSGMGYTIFCDADRE